MTQCRAQLAFSFHHSTTVVADFKGGLITSDAGLLPLRELDDRLGWTARIAACLDDPREAGKVQHDLVTLLRQRLFGLIAGYEDANDHTRLRHDPILKTLTGRRLTDDLASQPTLSRFENWITARQVAQLNRLLPQQFIQRHRTRRLKRLILDIDPTDDPCHGHQQLALFSGFYGQYMYLPLLIFERESGMLLGVRLRAGTVSAPNRLSQLLDPILAEDLAEFGIETLEQAALRYLLDVGPGVVPIPGTSRPDRVAGLAATADLPPVPLERWQALQRTLSAIPEMQEEL